MEYANTHPTFVPMHWKQSTTFIDECDENLGSSVSIQFCSISFWENCALSLMFVLLSICKQACTSYIILLFIPSGIRDWLIDGYLGRAWKLALNAMTDGFCADGSFAPYLKILWVWAFIKFSEWQKAWRRRKPWNYVYAGTMCHPYWIYPPFPYELLIYIYIYIHTSWKKSVNFCSKVDSIEILNTCIPDMYLWLQLVGFFPTYRVYYGV